MKCLLAGLLIVSSLSVNAASICENEGFFTLLQSALDVTESTGIEEQLEYDLRDDNQFVTRRFCENYGSIGAIVSLVIPFLTTEEMQYELALSLGAVGDNDDVCDKYAAENNSNLLNQKEYKLWASDMHNTLLESVKKMCPKLLEDE